MMRKNRKGDLMNNMVGIIIALIGILIFGYALVQLYNVNVNQERENAKNTLNSIVAKIESLENGQNNTFAIQGFVGADDWYLVGWDKEDISKKPDKCFFGSCLCVCKGADEKQVHIACQNEGICVNPDKDKVEVRTYFENLKGVIGERIGQDFTSDLVKREEDKYSFCAKLPENLGELEIFKTEDAIDIILVNRKNTQIVFGNDYNLCYR